MPRPGLRLIGLLVLFGCVLVGCGQAALPEAALTAPQSPEPVQTPVAPWTGTAPPTEPMTTPAAALTAAEGGAAAGTGSATEPATGAVSQGPLNLELDLDSVAPADALQELSLFVSYAGGGWDEPVPSTCCAGPTLIAASTLLQARTLGPWPQACWGEPCFYLDVTACGFHGLEPLALSLVDPQGEVVFEQAATAQAEEDDEVLLATSFCTRVFGLAGYELLPGDPLGEYRLEIASQEAHLQHPFTVELGEPLLFYSERQGAYVIAGFAPFETVRVLRYRALHVDDVADEYLLVGEGRLRLDGNGAGTLSGGSTEETLIAVGEGLDLAATNLSLTSALDYDGILEADPTNARAYYRRGLLRYRNMRDRLADLSRSIELDGEYLPAYRARGEAYEEAGGLDAALADYSHFLEAEPASVPALYARARVYQALGLAERALADLNKGFELDRGPTYTAGLEEYDRAIALDPSHTLAYLRRAQEQERRMEYDLAAADYGRAIELDAQNADAYLGRVRNAGRADPAQATADLSRALELRPDSLAALYSRASLYSGQGDPAAAVADYDRIVALHPGVWVAYYLRAQAREAMADDVGAVADYGRYVELAPPEVASWGHSARASAYERLGDAEHALEEYGRAVELEPSAPDALFARGAFYDRQGQAELALADLRRGIELEEYGSYDHLGVYSRAIELDASCAPAYFRRGEVELRDGIWSGDVRAAIDDLSRAIEIDGGYAAAYEQRAEAYLVQGDPGQAMADYTSALELDSGLLAARDGRASLYQEQGELGKAIDDYAAIVAAEPGYTVQDWQDLAGAGVPVLDARAQLYAATGRYDEAIADYGQLIQLESGKPAQQSEAWRFYALRGGLYDLTGDAQKAVADLRQAMELEPGAGSIESRYLDLRIETYSRLLEHAPDEFLALYKRGWVLELQGRLEEALADYERAVELQPQVASLYYHRAMLHLKLGDDLSAEADLARSEELSPGSLRALVGRARLLAARGFEAEAVAEAERFLALCHEVSGNCWEGEELLAELGAEQ